MLFEFFKGFWNYVSIFPWWQGLIIIFVVVITIVLGKFWRNVIIWIGDRLYKEKSNVEYRMFWGIINDVLNIRIKDEIRRSFKENGFSEISGVEFSQYVKNESKLIITLLKNHIINLYPPIKRGIKIPMKDVMEFIDKKESKLEDIIFEIYIEAKRLKKQDEEILKIIDERFEKEIETFIIQRTNPADCRNCLVVMFGKGEIAKNKKSNIKTLRSQMNFVELKLSEIQSDIMSFYNDKYNKK